MRAWSEREHEIVDALFRFSPGWGRLVGDHRFDGVVGDVSGTAVAARLEEIDRQLRMLDQPDHLGRDDDVDRRALQAQLATSRFELVELASHRRDPMFYAGGAELDVSCYIKRDYAPLGERLEALRRHLDGVPGFLEAARSNLEQALPRPSLDVALEALEGFVTFLNQEVRTAARDDATTLAAIERAARAVGDFAAWLGSHRPQAHDDYALGTDRFLRYLETRELIRRDLPTLERMARDDLARNTARAAEVAEMIAPGEGIAGAVRALETHHPSVDTLIADTAAMLEGIRDFLIEHRLVSIPSEVRCRVSPTPSFLAYISAALDSAGALETVATESYYYVTVPTREWGKARTEEWLRYLNYSLLANVSIHEAYPGHYLQALHERRARSLTRKVLWIQSTGEGWAHYTEQMMVEEQFSRDPKHEMAQLMDALLRDCRFLAAVGLHCHRMPMDEAVRLFTEQSHHSELPAVREATRGAWDPLYLNYTLGKLLICELRQSFEASTGGSRQRFHDDFLACGNLPIPLIAELLHAA